MVSGQNPNSPDSNQKLILIAEDHPVTGMLLNKLITRLGHQVKIVTSGAEAIKSAAADSPSLIFVDLRLPDMSGFDVASEIRARTDISDDVQILGFSADVSKEDRTRGESAGMNAVYLKELELDYLKRLIETHS